MIEINDASAAKDTVDHACNSEKVEASLSPAVVDRVYEKFITLWDCILNSPHEQNCEYTGAQYTPSCFCSHDKLWQAGVNLKAAIAAIKEGL